MKPQKIVEKLIRGSRLQTTQKVFFVFLIWFTRIFIRWIFLSSVRVELKKTSTIKTKSLFIIEKIIKYRTSGIKEENLLLIVLLVYTISIIGVISLIFFFRLNTIETQTLTVVEINIRIKSSKIAVLE